MLRGPQCLLMSGQQNLTGDKPQITQALGGKRDGTSLSHALGLWAGRALQECDGGELKS